MALPRSALLPLLLSSLLAAPACGDDDDDDDVADVTDDERNLVLFAAGVPLDRFGDEDAPDFDAAFGEMADDGWDAFFPFFGTGEDDSGNAVTRHFEFFMPPGLFGPGTYDCTTDSPYAAMRAHDLGVVFPAFLFAADATQPFDADAFRTYWGALVDDCMGGDDGVVLAVQNYDEAANNATVTAWLTPEMAFRAENVAALATEVRDLTDVPLVQVEAVLPLAFEINPDLVALPEDEKAAVIETFWTTVDAEVEYTDWFGFDVYPVGTDLPLSVSGDWVTQADEHHDGDLLAALQGFAPGDLAGNQTAPAPTLAEQRFMALHAIVRGARRLVWWGASMMEDRDGWEAIRQTVRDLRRVDPLFGIAGEALAIAGDDIEQLSVIDADARTSYAIVTHAADAPGTATVTVPFDGAFVIEDYLDLDADALAEGEVGDAREVPLAIDAWGAVVIRVRAR
jgi:hypothetical protein